jgi:hypothetical protein
MASPVLPATAAVGLTTAESVTAVELATAAVETLASAESTVAMPSAVAVETLASTESTIATPSVVAMESFASAKSVMVAVPSTAIVAAPSTVIAATIKAMEPRTRADKHSAGKVIRAVVTVGCAGIRRIVIIAVGTSGRRANVTWADSHDNLGICSTSRQEREESNHNHVL